VTVPERGLADTSLFIATETDRPIRHDRMPTEISVCVITVAELRAGVLAAQTVADRAARLVTLEHVGELQPLPVDVAAASAWARLRVEIHQAGRRVNVNDLWIAAVALANNLPVVTQDGDFRVLAELGLLNVIEV
jgi:predicted nucleic acid-binding protein